MARTRVYYEVDSYTASGRYVLQKFLPKELSLIGSMLKDGMTVKEVRRVECDLDTWKGIFE